MRINKLREIATKCLGENRGNHEFALLANAFSKSLDSILVLTEEDFAVLFEGLVLPLTRLVFEVESRGER